MVILLRFYFLFLMLICAVPAWASNDEMAAAAQKKSEILRLFEVQPPRLAVDTAILAVADSRYRPGDPARDEFVSRMQLSVDYDAIERAAIEAMMTIYTLPELSAMADYYTSELGQEAEGKKTIFREKMAPLLKEMLDKGDLNVITSPSSAQSVTGQ